MCSENQLISFMAIFATHGCFTGVVHVILLVIKIKFVGNIFPTLTWFSVQENTGVQGRGLEIRNSERRRKHFYVFIYRFVARIRN